MGIRQVRSIRTHLTNALIVAVVCASGCTSGDSTRVDDVHRRTARSDATATAPTEVERSANGVRFAWDVRVQGTWLEYRTQMVEAFRSDFSVVRSDAASLTMARSAHGDSYRVEFQPTASSPITQVHVVFLAIAD